MRDIKTVAVIGANGTMGSNVSAIFAAFGDAKVYMVCRSVDKSQDAINKAYKSVKAESVKENMIPADYSMLEKIIPECDLVFESAAETWEVKVDINNLLLKTVDMEKNANTIFATGTSGLSITGLAKLYPDQLRKNFMGIHMFNPPYSLTLCEVIPTEYTDQIVLEEVKLYCKKKLLRTVVEVKDSPAFLGNRIGFQFINEALQYAEKYKAKGGIDYIDAILGPFTGRAMAPLVTANFVGLDVHKAIVDNIYTNTNDFAHDGFVLPNYVGKLIVEGKLGRKSGAGLYKTIVDETGAKVHQVYDIENEQYRNVTRYKFDFIESMIEFLQVGDYPNAFLSLIEDSSEEAKICLTFMLKYVIYSLEATLLVSDDIHAADDVMATGFNWCPPLAIVEALGGIEKFKQLIKEKIDASIFANLDVERLLSYYKTSNYDFRRYIKAKR